MHRRGLRLVGELRDKTCVANSQRNLELTLFVGIATKFDTGSVVDGPGGRSLRNWLD